MNIIVLRKKILPLGYVHSAYIGMQNGREYAENKQLIADFGWGKIMNSLFCEELDSETLQNSSLYKSFLEFMKSDKRENDFFIKAYQINNFYAVFLDANIYLFHLFPKGEIYTDFVPWYYADAKKYLGDTWWESDEEILGNLKNMSVVDFLDRYKGYM